MASAADRCVDASNGFAQRKAQTLAELAADAGDFSRAGHVDVRARPVVGLVNRHPSFFTTSSCSGRVSVFADPTSASRAAGMKGGEWVYVSHEPASADEVVAAVDEAVKKARGGPTRVGGGGGGEHGVDGTDGECTLVLRFEPFILSVEAASVEEGSRMVSAARDAGYRESGITACDKRTIIAVRCSIRMETPVVWKGVRLVDEQALRQLVAIANDKWAANAARAERLVERFTAVFGREMAATSLLSLPPGVSQDGEKGAEDPRDPRADRVEKTQRDILAALDAIEEAVGGGGDEATVAAAVAAGRAARLRAAAGTEQAGEGGDWIFLVDKGAAKRCKDAIKSCKWLDQTRRAGAGRNGARIALPITSAGALTLLRAQSAGGECSCLPAAEPALLALCDGTADLIDSTATPHSGNTSGGAGHAGDGDAVQLQPKPQIKSPAIVIKAAALRATSAAAMASSEIPTKWEKLGDLALLPSGSFSSDAVWTPTIRRQLYPAVAAALGVTRLARQAEVSQGPKRESRAIMLWDPERRGGWVETLERGVTYGLDVTKVMFSSGNGTEKARMGDLPAAGETVVDLFAGIGYYTLQLLCHASVAKVYACEWNPNSVAALKANLALNRISAHRCEILEGDNRRTAPAGVADRVLLGLLPDSECSWATAVAALKPETGGVLHVHGNVRSGEESAWARRLETEIGAMSVAIGRVWTVRVEHVERVKWYAPRVRHVVADVRCVPSASPTAAAPEPKTRMRTEQSGARAGKGNAKLKTNSSAATSRGSVSVRHMHRPSPTEFRSGPVSSREPCVLTGLDIGPAPWLWSPQHLATKPAVAAADVSVHVSETPHLDFVRKNFKFKNIPFGELLAALAAEAEEGKGDENKKRGKTWYYLRSIGRNPRKEPAHALEQFPDLAEELKLPSDVLWGGEDERYFSAVLRCSSGGLRLWTHYDAMDNALVQLHGEKRVILFPPSAGAGLYLDGSSSPVVGAAVDGKEDAWGADFPFPAYTLARAAALEVVLQPGDVLYIPALWAHHVEALHGPSVAVNVFFRELPKANYPGKDLYGNADPVLAGRALEACREAARDLAGLPRDHRVFYGGVAAAQLLRDLRIEEEVGTMVAPSAAQASTSCAAERVVGGAALRAWVIDWTDATKGAVAGAAVAGLVTAALVWARPR